MAAESRRAIAERLVGLHVRYAPVFRDIDDLKDKLRKFAADEGGFTEEIAGKGLVQVSGGSEPKFKGIVPVLDEAKFLDLSQVRQDALTDAGIITMEKQFTKGSKPSVTVKL
jgi:hypothetical protein